MWKTVRLWSFQQNGSELLLWISAFLGFRWCKAIIDSFVPCYLCIKSSLMGGYYYICSTFHCAEQPTSHWVCTPILINFVCIWLAVQTHSLTVVRLCQFLKKIIFEQKCWHVVILLSNMEPQPPYCLLTAIGVCCGFSAIEDHEAWKQEKNWPRLLHGQKGHFVDTSL